MVNGIALSENILEESHNPLGEAGRHTRTHGVGRLEWHPEIQCRTSPSASHPQYDGTRGNYYSCVMTLQGCGVYMHKGSQ